MAREPNEEADIATVRSLIFERHGLHAERFSRAELLASRTPDFRLFNQTHLVAYSEIKSPRDDWLDEQLIRAAPGQIVGGLRDDPIFNRLARHIQKAATQFDAVNPSRELPNILIFVNHDRASNSNDLYETLTGRFPSVNGSQIATMMHIAEGRIGQAKRRIDLFAWLDMRTRRPRYFFPDESPHRVSVRRMFNFRD